MDACAEGSSATCPRFRKSSRVSERSCKLPGVTPEGRRRSIGREGARRLLARALDVEFRPAWPSEQEGLEIRALSGQAPVLLDRDHHDRLTPAARDDLR